MNKLKFGHNTPFMLIAGPCVIENYNTTYDIALYLKKLTKKLNIPFVFKASYDKANRTSINSFRGPGVKDGLNILNSIKTELNINILSDVHNIDEIQHAASVLDIIQIPAFLCRQTDFILEIARTGKTVNVKKGQFLAPWDIIPVIEKIKSTGNNDIFITERGTMFGYNNLVVDFRGIKIMQDKTNIPVIFDATHSVQLPGAGDNCSGGQRNLAPTLAKAAIAAGADGLFIEVHPNPDQALCDGPNSLKLDEIESLLSDLKAINSIVKHSQEAASSTSTGT